MSDSGTARLEESLDPELQFRPLAGSGNLIAGTLLFLLSIFHYYTAGFGLLRETTHRGVHMAFVLGLIFLVFPVFRRGAALRPAGWLRPAGIPLADWLFGLAAAVSVMYVPYIYDELAFRVGNPLPIDVVMGTILIVALLEAARRTMGWPLPAIALTFILYALFGRYAPGVLVHPGTDWSGLVNHLYLTSQGIYGIAVGVVATYVFHFVLFGVLATRIGLGQLFIDLASWVAGRYAGGPAKVAVFSSALFGSISGSSIANTVTTGSLTIPAMIRVGYPRHFAAAVEATASTGGQIMPPVMGAAAFLMIEFLGMPYQQIMLAALTPALLHFFAIFVQVHLEAKRHGLRGLTPDEMPRIGLLLARQWFCLAPLVVLLAVLLQGYTPYMAAFWGITLCIVVGVVNPHRRLGLRDLAEAFQTGAKYALAVGAAAAAVGIIIGVVTLTGVGFKISYIVTTMAAEAADTIQAVIPLFPVSRDGVALFFTLVLTALVCIVMGCGVPTTATYLIMVAIVAPTLGMLGVIPVVAHFFVFYYGVLADITPPVALAAYAAAGIGNANPFQTGNTAFRLAMAKIFVPFVFVYSPSLLIVVPDFSWGDYTVALIGCVLGIVCLAAAFSGWFLVRMRGWEAVLVTVAAVFLIVPGITPTILGAVLVLPALASQIIRSRHQ